MDKRRLSLNKRQAMIGALFLLPFVMHFILFVIYPFFSTIVTSFTNQNLLSMQNDFIGFKNYIDVLKDRLFLKSLSNTAIYVLIDGVGVVVFGMLMALVLNQKIKGISFFRISYYIPVLVDWVIVSIVFLFILEPSFGIANYVLRQFNLPSQGFLTDPNQALIIISIASIWKGSGYYAVFFLAALQDVPTDLKEAAQIDGASRFKVFFHISLPQIMPVVIFVILISFIGALKGFDQFYIMSKGGPARSTTTIMYYFYEVAFTNLKTGKGSSIAMIFTAIVMILVGMQRLIATRISGAEGVN
jgi:ABC-type sugar transport system permease subunit